MRPKDENPSVARANKSKQDGGRTTRQSSSTTNEVVTDEAWECKKCSKSITGESDIAMECSICEDKYCGPCIGLSTKEYEAVKILVRDDFLWLCHSCLPKAHALNVNNDEDGTDVPNEFNARLQTLEGKFDDMVQHVNASLSDFTSSLSQFPNKCFDNLSENKVAIAKSVEMSVEKTIEKSVSDACQSEFRKKFSETLVGKAADTNTITRVKEKGVTGIMEDIIIEQKNAQQKEENVKEEREKNVIIYKHPEIEGISLEERRNNDKTFVKALLKELNREDIEVKGIMRLGKFDSDSHKDGKCRPIKLVLYSKGDRDSVMRNAFKLGETDKDDLKNIKLGYDLSQTERSEIKAKIDEAKSKSDEQFFYRVRGPPWSLRLQRVTRRQK